MNIVQGAVLTNQELSSLFKVGNMGGMRRSKLNNCLVLISDPFKGLYEDKWDGTIFHYTGMGKKGDQNFTSQNKTLRDAKQLSVSVYLFEVFEPTKYSFIGEVELAGEIYTEIQPDDDGNLRKVLMFPLKLVDGEPPKFDNEALAKKDRRLSEAAKRKTLAELSVRVKYVKGSPGRRITTSFQFDRNQDVAEYVFRKANGNCQLCELEAPFKRPSGEPYLEVHHVVWLGKNGEDAVENTVALCPNCHRKMHIVDDRDDVSKLKIAAARNAEDIEI